MICCIVGARPNFIKMAPIVQALTARHVPQTLIHTGQHYDAQMSAVFFDELHLPRPALDLGIGSGTPSQQSARILTALEPVFQELKPALVLVAGDVTSTLAAALAAAQLQIPVAHLEAGLRSFDRAMPEELNRVLTDHLSDLLFTTETSANDNLLREGIAPEKIAYVGNCMIDSLDAHLTAALAREPWKSFDLAPYRYGVVTLHRPSNVDDPAELRATLATLAQASENLPLIFPVHPRTRAQLESVMPEHGNIHLTEPLGYLDFLGLMARARLVLTDSGGVQEETTALGIPCLTLRANTERPITLTHGTNQLVGTDRERILDAVHTILATPPAPKARPPLWDGHAAERVVGVIVGAFN